MRINKTTKKAIEEKREEEGKRAAIKKRIETIYVNSEQVHVFKPNSAFILFI